MESHCAFSLRSPRPYKGTDVWLYIDLAQAVTDIKNGQVVKASLDGSEFVTAVAAVDGLIRDPCIASRSVQEQLESQ